MKKIEEINVLRAEARKIPDTELSKKAKGEIYNQNYIKINVDELAEQDLEIYNRILNQTLTRETFFAYRTDIVRDNESRKFFMEWMQDHLFLPENIKWFDPEEYEANKEIYDSL